MAFDLLGGVSGAKVRQWPLIAKHAVLTRVARHTEFWHAQ